MGNCVASRDKKDGGGGGGDDKDEARFILTPDDVTQIKNSWKIVVKGGLAKYGTMMMIK